MGFKNIESKIGFAPMKWATLFPFGDFIGQAELAVSIEDQNSSGLHSSIGVVRLRGEKMANQCEIA